jgi:monofunctional biosynthetic peptidoglycan transglycosylase
MSDGMERAAQRAGVSTRAGAGRQRRRWLRLLLRAVLALLLVPVVLVPAYLVVRPVSTLMIFTRLFDGPVARDWVSFDDIAPALVASVIMSEDGRFCDHSGVDWQEMGKVMDRSADHPRGASTIAMQTVKNLFLWTSRSYLRKGLEIPLALYADLVWSKRRLMEIYLNVVEWGPGIFGAEAAARHYFNRPAKQLTAGQAALLAVTLPNPALRNPAHPTRHLQAIARIVADRARMSGAYIGCLYP